MSFKAQSSRRHHLPRQKHRVTNRAEYDAGLRARGSLTVWFTPEAVEAWKAEPRTGRGGQPSYPALAIATALTLRAVFRLALRKTEGLIGIRGAGGMTTAGAPAPVCAASEAGRSTRECREGATERPGSARDGRPVVRRPKTGPRGRRVVVAGEASRREFRLPPHGPGWKPCGSSRPG